MPEEKWDTLVEIDYVLAKDFIETNVHGAYGGVNAARELSICFFEEGYAIPEKMIVKVNSKGNRVEELIGNDKKARRIIKARITIPIDRVQVLIDWMQKHVNECKGMENEVKNDDGSDK